MNEVIGLVDALQRSVEGSRIQHVEKSFSLVWDTVGVHDVPIDVSFDGKQLTNVSGSPNLKIIMTIS